MEGISVQTPTTPTLEFTIDPDMCDADGLLQDTTVLLHPPTDMLPPGDLLEDDAISVDIDDLLSSEVVDMSWMDSPRSDSKIPIDDVEDDIGSKKRKATTPIHDDFKKPRIAEGAEVNEGAWLSEIMDMDVMLVRGARGCSIELLHDTPYIVETSLTGNLCLVPLNVILNDIIVWSNATLLVKSSRTWANIVYAMLRTHRNKSIIGVWTMANLDSMFNML